MVSVLAAAQQTILLETVRFNNLREVRARLCARSNEPRWTIVFAWQSHLMFLSWALVAYVAGLTSYIASPVALHPAWDDNAKV